jgi:hypothetical protein
MKPTDPNDDQAYVDSLFAELPRMEPSAELRRLVAAIPEKNQRPARVVWPFRSVWQPTFALAAAACIGFFSGQTIQQLRVENAPAELASTSDELTSSEDSFENGAALDPSLSGTGSSLSSANGASSEADSELEGLLILATATDFEASDFADTFQETQASSELEEETF